MNRPGTIARARALLVILCGLLIACTTTSSMSDTNTIPPGKGIMVFRTSSQYSFKLSWVEYSTRFLSTDIPASVAGEAGQKTWVLTVDAGHYSWANTQVMALYPPLQASFQQINRFEVEEGKVNYVGDVFISAYSVSDLIGTGQVGLDIESNPTEMLSYLNVWYPQLIAHYPFQEHVTQFH